ncbi:DUF1642 domain-containing protein [Streptococcus uberis]|uniref:DUF1642 domain-containing protein n=1 Tax=Streptococcus uberis TaxID=1349 RepID=UPI0020C1608A|nr:DUF1642 domain-containing protein [Streptococcus uberis]
MKIEEAKKEVNDLSFCGKHPSVIKERVNRIIDQIEPDQPKIEVPQMIFDVIENFDDDVDYLHQHMRRQSDEVREWLTHNERDFYEAWLAYPNITVEKEKLYTVEIPNRNGLRMGICRAIDGICVVPIKYDDWDKKTLFQLTEQEIRKDFDWAWQWKKEVTE